MLYDACIKNSMKEQIKNKKNKMLYKKAIIYKMLYILLFNKNEF